MSQAGRDKSGLKESTLSIGKLTHKEDLSFGRCGMRLGNKVRYVLFLLMFLWINNSSSTL